jgi:hypothetical protein
MGAIAVGRNPTLSAYMNHGYWTCATTDDRRASENLMEKVVGIKTRYSAAERAPTANATPL